MAVNNSQTIKKTVAELLKNISPRNRDVISRRFGLKTGSRETLESIGASYDITRERVRQIEEATLTSLRSAAAANPQVNQIVQAAKGVLTAQGGVMKEDALLVALGGSTKDAIANASLNFLLTVHNELTRHGDSDEFHPLWAVHNDALKNFKHSTASLVKVLEKTGRVVPHAEFIALTQKYSVPSFATPQKTISEPEVQLAMQVSKQLAKNIFGEVGLATSPEIRPKGVRDKAYLVLKKAKTPKHFSEITKLINESGFAKRTANMQTVHNELIKDSRFILIGRGLYALAEWGYKPGTVKDVLTDVLRTSGKPLSKAAILMKVKEARMVKDNTILLNLQDAKTFVKKDDGTYTIRG